MQQSSYDFKKATSLGHVIEAKPYDISETQKKIQVHGDVIAFRKLAPTIHHLNLSESQGSIRIRNLLFSILR